MLKIRGFLFLRFVDDCGRASRKRAWHRDRVSHAVWRSLVIMRAKAR